jgi:glycine cleavage system H protein
VYAPANGEVVDINSVLTSEPSLINQHSEDKGWMMKLKVDDVDSIKGLMNETEYAKFCQEAAH